MKYVKMMDWSNLSYREVQSQLAALRTPKSNEVARPPEITYSKDERQENN